MKVGDLVRNIHTGEVGLIIAEDGKEYVIVDDRWTVPREHLEVITGEEKVSGDVIVYTGTHFWSNKKEHLKVISEGR